MALDLLQKMRMREIAPNTATYNSVPCRVVCGDIINAAIAHGFSLTVFFHFGKTLAVTCLSYHLLLETWEHNIHIFEAIAACHDGGCWLEAQTSKKLDRWYELVYMGPFEGLETCFFRTCIFISDQ